MESAVLVDTIQVNIQRVQERIEQAARSSGRSPGDIRLVIVTKGHPVDVLRALIQAGGRILGENYVEEAAEKIATLGAEREIEWHMIGHIQGRKARSVCEHFQYVHSLDSLRLAERLDRFACELGLRMPVLLECNISGEQSKFGFPAWLDEHWVELHEQAQQVSMLPNLELRGLMTMAPFFDQAELARPYFKRLGLLRHYLAGKVPQVGWDELSMGMSADYEVAIQEGATIVRVGQAILGPRPV